MALTELPGPAYELLYGGHVASSERRSFYRHPEVPGVELLEATSSTQSWRVLNLDFGLWIPETWCARVNHEGRELELSPGHALLLRPGEVHSTAGAQRAGVVRAMSFSGSAFQSHLAAESSPAPEPHWRNVFVRCSPRLMERFVNVFDVLRYDAKASAFLIALAELGAVIVEELIVTEAPNASYASPRRAERMRELIRCAPEGQPPTLEQLSSAVGLTRFQALRCFKKRYGLPPHEYQLVARIQQAMLLLRRGERPTHIAHLMGFADHSHFTRHFKRLVGMTPRDYATAGKAPPFFLPKPARQ